MNPMLSNATITAILSPELSDADIRWILMNVINIYDEQEIEPPPDGSLLSVIWRMIEAEQTTMYEKAKESHNRRSLAGKQSHKSLQNVNKNQAMLNIVNIREDKIREDKISKDKYKIESTFDIPQKPSFKNLDFSSQDIFLTDDPIGYAMWLTNSNKITDKRTFAKYLKANPQAFREIVNELYAEKCQGEHKNAQNLPAILTKKLKRIK